MAAPRKVSIALATYNGAKYLAEQLSSFAAQTLLPDELVVGDDCSSDATLKIIEDFAETVPFPVKVTRNPAALGPARNFFETAKRCTGDVILFSDQDDIWHSDKIEVLLDHFATDPQCWLVTHDAALVDAELNPLGLTLASQIESAYLGEAARDLVAGCCMAFDRRVLALVEMLPNSREHDATLAHATTLLGLRCHLPDVLIDYRRHGGNVSESFMSSASAASSWTRFVDRFRRARAEPVSSSLAQANEARSDLIAAFEANRELFAGSVPPELFEETLRFLESNLAAGRLRLAIHQAPFLHKPARLMSAWRGGAYAGPHGRFSLLRDLAGLFRGGGGS